MDTKKLRQKILDLAIRGKLVPHDPNDEPASVLLDRIRAEKERLINEGKIKRSKKTASDDEIEAPFEIPESWEWVRLEDFVMAVTDGDHQPPPQTATGVPFLVISDVNTGCIDFSHARYVSEEYYNKLPAIRQAAKGDILFTVTGSYGITILVDTERFFCFQRHIGLIKTIRYSEWISVVLKSNYVLKYCDKVATGTAQKTVSLGHLRDLLIPIPPFTEQQRIANEVDRWFAVIDELETNEGDLLTAINQAKSKILDLAIHGKLVPQDPNDEPAIDLLKRINPKFEACDNIPYYIPENWSWATGVDIFEPMKSTTPSGDTFKYIDIDAIDNKRNIIFSAKQINTKDAPSRASRFTEKGNVLFSMVRPYLRNIAMVPEDDCIASTGFYVCRPKALLDSKYSYYMMLSEYVVDGLNSFMKGDNSPSINKNHIDSFAFPLPPYPEQLRIVAKIEELFTVLDSIKESLELRMSQCLLTPM